MDTLTHTVLGACMGEAIAGRKLGKRAMLIGALAHNLPDVDVISGLWTSQAEGLLAHRGITHSILFNAVMAFLLPWIFSRTSKKQMPYSQWLLLIGSGLLTHIVMDAFTSYGTGWFEPFSHYRVAFNTLFILDPFLLLPMLVISIMLLVLKADSPRRRRVAVTGLCIGLFYLVITWMDKYKVNSVADKNLHEQNIPFTEYMSTPAPLNNFLWYIVTRSDTGDPYVGYYSVFDKDENVSFERFAKNDSLLEPYREDEEVQRLLRFSKRYYCMTLEEGNIVFNDMRFGQVGGWYTKQAPFVFNFNIAGSANSSIQLQQGRFRSMQPDALGQLYRRAMGHK